jgi:PEP-CTERM motif
MSRLIYIATLFVGVGLFGYTPAHADAVYNLDIGAPSSWGAGSFGTITLTQDGSNAVDVTETLTTGFTFASGPFSGHALDYNLDNQPTISQLTNGFASFQYGVGYAIYTNTAGLTSLSFTLTDSGGLTANDFENFVSEIVNPNIGPFGTAGFVVASPSTSAVPEPATFAILGMGLLGLDIVRKRAC